MHTVSTVTRNETDLDLDELYALADPYETETGEIEVPELSQLMDEQFITEILLELKSGKEATAWVCAGGPASGADLLVAKIYRPIDERGFKNDAVYQEGRWGGDKRIRRAFEQKSRVGREAQFSSWLGHEYRTLTLLHEAGADVPQPIAKGERAILMEYVGDESGPAPLLKDVRLDGDDARRLFDRLLWNVETFLTCDRVHGDLSPFNILFWEGEAIVIDFPQAVEPEVNRNAYTLLERDLANLCTHFRRFGIRADPGRITADMWMRYTFRDMRM